jgi:hypothetical protein
MSILFCKGFTVFCVAVVRTVAFDGVLACRDAIAIEDSDALLALLCSVVDRATFNDLRCTGFDDCGARLAAAEPSVAGVKFGGSKGSAERSCWS